MRIFMTRKRLLIVLAVIVVIVVMFVMCNNNARNDFMEGFQQGSIQMESGE